MPVALYYYGELGLETFSVAEFRKRDRYSNPARWPALFEALAAEGWITPLSRGRYRVTERARQAVAAITGAGDAALGALDTLAEPDLRRLLSLVHSGAASTAEEIAARQAFRGWSPADYAVARPARRPRLG